MIDLLFKGRLTADANRSPLRKTIHIEDTETLSNRKDGVVRSQVNNPAFVGNVMTYTYACVTSFCMRLG